MYTRTALITQWDIIHSSECRWHKINDRSVLEYWSRDMLRVQTPCNCGSECTAFEIGSARYFSTRDPGYGATSGGWGRSPSSQLQFVFALKRNITWWDLVEDSADASCVVLYNVPSISRIIRYRFDWSRVRSIFQLRREAHL